MSAALPSKSFYNEPDDIRYGRDELRFEGESLRRVLSVAGLSAPRYGG